MAETLTIELLRLHKRMTKLYDCYNKQDWAGCFDLLDPKLREHRVKFKTYKNSLSAFFGEHGPITISDSVVGKMKVYHVKNRLYDDRPFALGQVDWQDNDHQPHIFRECWVWFRGTWYSRKTGLV